MLVAEDGVRVEAEAIDELVLHMTLLDLVSRLVDLLFLKGNGLLYLLLR